MRWVMQLYSTPALGFFLSASSLFGTGPNNGSREAPQEGQEDQLSALGLVVNVIVLWNTLYMDAAVNHLRLTGYDVKSEDLARLAPLENRRTINVLGQYSFALPEPVKNGALRPLRDPSEVQDEDEEGESWEA